MVNIVFYITVLVVGTLTVIKSTKKDFDPKRIAGKQKIGESNEDYIKRQRKKAMVLGVILMVMGLFYFGQVFMKVVEKMNTIAMVIMK